MRRGVATSPAAHASLCPQGGKPACRGGVATSPVAYASSCLRGGQPAYTGEWPPLLLLTPPRARKAGSLHTEGSGHLSCCSCLLVTLFLEFKQNLGQTSGIWPLS